MVDATMGIEILEEACFMQGYDPSCLEPDDSQSIQEAKVELYRRVLLVVGFFEAVEKVKSGMLSQSSLPVYSWESLEPLRQWVIANHALLEKSMRFFPAIPKVKKKTLRYLSTWLGHMGLKQHIAHRRNKQIWHTLSLKTVMDAHIKLKNLTRRTTMLEIRNLQPNEIEVAISALPIEVAFEDVNYAKAFAAWQGISRQPDIKAYLEQTSYANAMVKMHERIAYFFPNKPELVKDAMHKLKTQYLELLDTKLAKYAKVELSIASFSREYKAGLERRAGEILDPVDSLTTGIMDAMSNEANPQHTATFTAIKRKKILGF